MYIAPFQEHMCETAIAYNARYEIARHTERVLTKFARVDVTRAIVSALCEKAMNPLHNCTPLLLFNDFRALCAAAAAVSIR